MSAGVEQQGKCSWPGPLLNGDKIPGEEAGGNNLTGEPVTQQPQHQGAQQPLADKGALCTCKFKQFLAPGCEACKVNPICPQLGK